MTNKAKDDAVSYEFERLFGGKVIQKIYLNGKTVFVFVMPHDDDIWSHRGVATIQ